jgi:hypothetical protein
MIVKPEMRSKRNAVKVKQKAEDAKGKIWSGRQDLNLTTVNNIKYLQGGCTTFAPLCTFMDIDNFFLLS